MQCVVIMKSGFKRSGHMRVHFFLNQKNIIGRSLKNRIVTDYLYDKIKVKSIGEPGKFSCLVDCSRPLESYKEDGLRRVRLTKLC